MTNYYKMPGMLAMLALLFTTSVFAQKDWELRKDEDGIQVYTRDAEGSSLKEFKAQATVHAPIASLVAVMKDVADFVNWWPNAKESTLLESSETEQHHYVVTNAPWPVSDRDGVYHFSFRKGSGEDSTSTFIYIDGVADYMPENDGKVRIPMCKGFWKFTPNESGVEVTYQMHADPGGSIPGWLANRAVVDSPFKTLASLQKQATLEKYRNASYSFLDREN